MFGSITKTFRRTLLAVVLLAVFIFGFKFFNEFLTFRKIIRNLKADTRIAEVLVVDSSLDEFSRRYTTTIKFLEYGVDGHPLDPKYFTFKGNLIQFQTLVVRFDDRYIEQGHRMKGKSIYLFLKAFVLNGDKTQEFAITRTVDPIPAQDPKMPRWRIWAGHLWHEFLGKPERPEYVVPEGYRVGNPPNYFEREIWAKFWRYALEPEQRRRIGIKSAQVEAPGSVFVPGTIYTLFIEHDGGVRIDTRPIPEILQK